MKNKRLTHLYIKNKLGSKEYHGNNLDALWDILSTYNQPMRVRLINQDMLVENLGDYGESLIGVFEEAKKENKYIEFEIL